MNFYLIVPLVLAGASLSLMGLVLRSNWRSWANRVFSLFLLSMGLWGFTIFGMRSSPDLETALGWEKMVIAAIAMTSFFFYRFAVIFTRDKEPKWAHLVSYAILAILVALAALGFVVKGMQLKDYGYAPVPTVLFYSLYLPSLYLFMARALHYLVVAYRRSSTAAAKNRIAYIVIGAVCSILGGTTDYLPVLGIAAYPMGIIGNIVFCALASLAIVRYNLLDIRLVIRKGLTYSLFSALAVGVYAVIITLLSSFFESIFAGAMFALNLILILVIAAALQPLLRLLQMMVDRWFLRQRYDHLRALEQFTEETKDIIDFTALASSLVTLVSLAMQSRTVALMLPTAEGHFSVVASSGLDAPSRLVLAEKSPVALCLKRHDGILSQAELEASPYYAAVAPSEQETVRHLGGMLYIPLKTKGRLSGILILGEKLSQQSYSEEDLRLLRAVTNQAAVSLENAWLFEQTRRDLELKTALLGEVHHRVKNSLAAVIGILSMEALNKRPRSTRRALQASIERIKSIATVHSLLTEEKLGEVNFYSLAKATIDNLQTSWTTLSKRVKFNLMDSGLVLSPKQATSLALLLNELIVNALRHAFPAGREGMITISAWEKDGIVALEIKDDGVGLPEGFSLSKDKGLGLQIIETIVRGSLSGNFTLTSDRGTTATVAFPRGLPTPPTESAAASINQRSQVG